MAATSPLSRLKTLEMILNAKRVDTPLMPSSMIAECGDAHQKVAPDLPWTQAHARGFAQILSIGFSRHSSGKRRQAQELRANET